MTSHVPDPLTPEEREMAARLARTGPHGEPSPALDARILGAAQAAAARKPGRDRSPRWPAWTGIAATLALALGAVWQLRPVQEVSVELEETPVQVLMRKPAEPSVASEAAMADEAADPVAPRPMPEPMRSIAPAKAAVAPPPPGQTRATKVPSPLPRTAPRASPAPPIVFDEPSPMDVMVRPSTPAPPPAPPAPPAPPPPTQAEAAMRDASGSTTGRAATVTVTVTDLPVASDSQLPPVDWIERIRQRRDAGDLASARASLALLQQDYPRWPLPDDVRAIAPAPPSDQ